MTSTTTAPARRAGRTRPGEPFYRFDGHFTDIVPIGPVPDGFRLNGHFAGSVTEGELAGAQVTGVDYFRVRADGVGVVRGHELVVAGDRVVAVELTGLLIPPEDVEAPTPADISRPGFAWPTEPYTIHVTASFETAAPDLAHLNTTIVAHRGTVNFTTGQLHIDAHVVG
jgi:hypothetical protein